MKASLSLTCRNERYVKPQKINVKFFYDKNYLLYTFYSLKKSETIKKNFKKIVFKNNLIFYYKMTHFYFF